MSLSLRPCWAKLFLAISLAAGSAFAQLTPEQKLADFHQLAGVYAKNYLPYQWKLQVFNVDLFNLSPWIEQVKMTKDDLEFYDVCVRYVASLRDSHDEFLIPSSFYAYLPIGVDIYDGQVLIEYVDRTVLPFGRFPIIPGSRLVAVDGKPVEQWLDELLPYSADGAGNDATRRRLAADLLVYRIQRIYPFAPRIGETASISVQDFTDEVATYEVPWTKRGTPLWTVGPVPTPAEATSTMTKSESSAIARAAKGRMTLDTETTDAPVNAWGAYEGPRPQPAAEPVPSYLETLRSLQVSEPTAQAGFGFFTPAFIPPAGFQLRLGASASDQFLSGTFPLGDYRVGFLRIPTMLPSNQTLAMAQFVNEILYFQQNTRGLVIDVTYNGGGDVCYVQNLMRYLYTQPFRGVTALIRATEPISYAFASSLQAAKNANADQWIIDLYTGYLAQLEEARLSYRGSTGDLPVCTLAFDSIPPATAPNGAPAGYDKPLMILVNEFSLSAAEVFAGLLQDEKRAYVVGTRTAGGGGNPGLFQATTYAMGDTRVTRTLISRTQYFSTPGYPPANHFENVGVYPNYWEDLQTERNFYTGGAQFVATFTSLMANLVAGNIQ